MQILAELMATPSRDTTLQAHGKLTMYETRGINFGLGSLTTAPNFRLGSRTTLRQDSDLSIKGYSLLQEVCINLQIQLYVSVL